MSSGISAPSFPREAKSSWVATPHVLIGAIIRGAHASGKIAARRSGRHSFGSNLGANGAEQLPLREKAAVDALHNIALAVVHEMDYLLTWNCTRRRRRVARSTPACRSKVHEWQQCPKTRDQRTRL